MDAKFFTNSEYQSLEKLYKLSPKNRLQTNAFNTADVEIVRIKKNYFLVSSTDSVAIEIHSGLYKNPETWGYLAIANSVSDLAASGAVPIGLLISSQWKVSHGEEIKDKVYLGMTKAMKNFKVPLLGGDSGSSDSTVLTVTVIGQTSRVPLSRCGVRPKDLVLSFGKHFGWGPALAFDFIMNKSRSKLEKKFRPKPCWQTINRFRKYFNASIDSSDGIYNSLTTLSAVNNLSFKIEISKIKLTPSIELFRREYSLPLEYFIESDLGDLQTLISISPKNYSLIKFKLPQHQVLASALKSTHSNTRQAILIKNTNYRSLSDVLIYFKMDYTKALKQWLKQFPSDKSYF